MYEESLIYHPDSHDSRQSREVRNYKPTVKIVKEIDENIDVKYKNKENKDNTRKDTISNTKLPEKKDLSQRDQISQRDQKDVKREVKEQIPQKNTLNAKRSTKDLMGREEEKDKLKPKEELKRPVTS